MKTILLAIPFILAVGLINYAQGSFSGFTIWNALPVAVGYIALLLGLRSDRAVTVGCIAFAASVTLLVTLFHAAWLFDWGDTASGSSTSGLAFIFVPIWAFGIAGITALIASGISEIIQRRRHLLSTIHNDPKKPNKTQMATRRKLSD